VRQPGHILLSSVSSMKEVMTVVSMPHARDQIRDTFFADFKSWMQICGR
jgi:hypothetical protein